VKNGDEGPVLMHKCGNFTSWRTKKMKMRREVGSRGREIFILLAWKFYLNFIKGEKKA
jgi:hypothetical protein